MKHKALMNTKIANYVGIALIAGIALTVSASFWYVSSYSRSVAPTRTFSVSAEAKVIAVPDVAELSFGLVTEGGTNLGDLQEKNAKMLNRIIRFLKDGGVDEKDIKTQFYNIAPRYQYFSCPPSTRAQGDISPEPCPPSEIVGYTINQNISLKIRDLNKAGDFLTGLVDNGANTVSGLSFNVDDPTELQNQAREEAIIKAKEKAKTIAKVGGFRLRKLISINEGIYLPSFYATREMLTAKSGGFGGDFAPDIEPGSQEIRVNISLTYEIK